MTNLKLTQVHRAAVSLRSALRRAPATPQRSDIVAAEKKAHLSTKGKIALSTAYTASWPSNTEFRIDPTREDIKGVIDRAEARLKKADANGDGKLSKTELATIKPRSTQTLAAFATEFK